MGIFYGSSISGKLAWGVFATAAMAASASSGNILSTAFSGTVAANNLAGAAVDLYRTFSPTGNSEKRLPRPRGL
jgi:hypothetical protein